jgi:hypothetical protein
VGQNPFENRDRRKINVKAFCCLQVGISMKEGRGKAERRHKGKKKKREEPGERMKDDGGRVKKDSNSTTNQGRPLTSKKS